MTATTNRNHHIVDLTKDEKKSMAFNKRCLVIEDVEADDIAVSLPKKSKLASCVSRPSKKVTHSSMQEKESCKKVLMKPPPRKIECKLGGNSFKRNMFVERGSLPPMPSIPKKAVQVEESHIVGNSNQAEKSAFSSPTCSVFLHPKPSSPLLKSKETKPPSGKLLGIKEDKAGHHHESKILKPDTLNLDARAVAELLDILKEDIEKAVVQQPRPATKVEVKEGTFSKSIASSKQHGKFDEIHSLMNMLMSGPPPPTAPEKNQKSKATKTPSKKTVTSEDLLMQLMKQK